MKTIKPHTQVRLKRALYSPRTNAKVKKGALMKVKASGHGWYTLKILGAIFGYLPHTFRARREDFAVLRNEEWEGLLELTIPDMEKKYPGSV